MELVDIRKRIDEINNEILKLFSERMDLSFEVAKYKKKNDLPIKDAKREEEILTEIKNKCPREYSSYAGELFSLIFKLSCEYQEKCVRESLEFGLIGESLGHSFSKRIHEKLASYDYRLINIPRDELSEFMHKRHFKGLNVTIPYKETVVPYCDELSERAKKVGCVNTLYIEKDGRLKGYNTDYDGFLALMEVNHVDVKDKDVLVLGTGGASLTVDAVLKDLGAKNIRKVSRSGEINYDNLYDFADTTEILINASPCGMYPKNGECLVDLQKLPNLKFVGDLIYNPLKTELLRRASLLGIPNANGLYMLISQAKNAAELFSGKTIPDEEMDAIYKEISKNVSNLVLIGMPGSGKTTVGEKAAAIMGREFVDTDREIEKKMGKTIPQIFKAYGEKGFRELEKECITEVSKRNGIILAVGGGSLIDPENIVNLSNNGVFCLIERDIELLATGGRPLSRDIDELRILKQERYPTYLSTADFKSTNRDADECAAKAVSKFRRYFA